MKRVALSIAAALIVTGIGGCFGPEPPPRPAHQSALVASAHYLATEAGAGILRAGGNAIDAAIAVQFALNVVEPYHSGIGGGEFILIWNATRHEAMFLDAREVAPAGASPDMFLLPGGEAMPFEVAHTRGIAVGVPGALAGWDLARRIGGTMDWNATLAPAVRLAEDGFGVDAYLAADVASLGNAPKLRSWPASAAVFFPGSTCTPLGPTGDAACIGGTAVSEGAKLRQPDLAKTLRAVQEDGARAFYQGPIAQAIVDTVHARGGSMALSDLAGYDVVRTMPLAGSYEGRTVLTSPPPGGGVVLLEMLGILEAFEPATMAALSTEALHLQIEAMHLAYADRAVFNADPAFVPVPVAGLLDAHYVASRRALIDTERADDGFEAGDPWAYNDTAYKDGPGHVRTSASGAYPEHGTTHFIVIDHAGNIVSSTSTIEAVFGTGMTVPGWGFLLNNQLTDFNFRPGGANEAGAGKRPRSSMVPTIVLDAAGEPVVVLGAAGGATITTSVLQVLMHVVDFGMDADVAVAAPRMFSASYDDTPEVIWDRGLPLEARLGLSQMGHVVDVRDEGGISQLQLAVRSADGTWKGAADDRAAPGSVAIVP